MHGWRAYGSAVRLRGGNRPGRSLHGACRVRADGRQSRPQRSRRLRADRPGRRHRRPGRRPRHGARLAGARSRRRRARWSASGRSLAELVADYAGTETPDAETECLARAVYYESKGEPLAGQLTVAEVIINRARSGRFPSTICGVVRQPGQFSFVRRGYHPDRRRSARATGASPSRSPRSRMQDLADGAAPRALFFHARQVRPGWRRPASRRSGTTSSTAKPSQRGL